MTQSDVHVLTWDPVCQRSVSFAKQLGTPLETIHYLSYRRPWLAPLKYPLQAAKTLHSLTHHRPSTIVVSNPPPFAALTVWSYCALTHSRFVIDAHTGVFLEPKWRPFLPLNRYLMRRAALTLVTNRALQQQVSQWGARAFVLPDPLPRMVVPSEKPALSPLRFHIAAVFSFYEDEPVEEMLSVRELPADVLIHVTGDDRRVARGLRRNLSPQISLTGFLPRAHYEALLWTADAVIVLCTRPHTLLCGAYEAVAVGKPLITSESEAMREYFRAGAIFVDNSRAGIEQGVREMRLRSAELTREMQGLRDSLQQEWRNTFAECLETIRNSASIPATHPPGTRRAAAVE